MKLYFNATYIDSGSPAVDPASPGYQFGLGAYETVKIFDGKTLFLEEHYLRFCDGLRSLEIDPPPSLSEIRTACDRLIDAGAIEAGYAKFICSKAADGGTDLLITVGDKNYDGSYARGFDLCMAGSRRNERSLLTGIKTLNHAENRLELARAEKAGYGEALFLNTAGAVSECTRSNIFWVKNGMVMTPERSCGLLPGITRAKVIALCTEAGLPVREGTFLPETVADADEIFLTSSLMGIMPVRRFEAGQDGILRRTVTEELMRLYALKYGIINK